MGDNVVKLPLSPSRTPSPRTILVIDDEEPIRKVLKTHLTKSGYQVLQSEGGRQVFSTIDQSCCDLVICDIKMPEVGGVEVIEYLTGRHTTVPIIMLTGLTDISVAIDVLKKGAFDFLMKPIKKHDLLTAIDKAIVHRDLLVRNEELERENREYQLFLEDKVKERTRALNERTIELQGLNEHLKHMNIQFVNVLAETIEAKDGHTSGHCNRMRYLCVELGRLAGLNPDELERLEYASLLHDLGKLGTSEAVLNKPGPLTKEEADHIKEHPARGEKILNGIELMEDVARIIGAHHENFDGSGYPKGIRGMEIPLEARIIAVADIFDAMSSDRPYRTGLPVEKVLEEMRRVSGSQLDPDIVKLFIDNKVFQFKKN